MIKKLELIIERTCHNCPYFNYDGGGDYAEECHYCNHPELEATTKWGIKTISKGSDLGGYERAYKDYLDSKTTLFPLDVSTIPENPNNIPEWCPLPDVP